jgi:hypothetical protein
MPLSWWPSGDLAAAAIGARPLTERPRRAPFANLHTVTMTVSPAPRWRPLDC